MVHGHLDGSPDGGQMASGTRIGGGRVKGRHANGQSTTCIVAGDAFPDYVRMGKWTIAGPKCNRAVAGLAIVVRRNVCRRFSAHGRRVVRSVAAYASAKRLVMRKSAAQPPASVN